MSTGTSKLRTDSIVMTVPDTALLPHNQLHRGNGLYTSERVCTMAKTLADFQQDVRGNVATGIQQVIDEIENLKAKEFHGTEGLARYLDRLVAFVGILNEGTDVHVRLQNEGVYDNRCCQTHYNTQAAIHITARETDTTT